MHLKHLDILIPEGDPFANCKLDRKKYAEALTDILSHNVEGFVLAIDNQWGTGKTTFIKMWEQLLKNEGFDTLHFNAWENDFEINPLAAILAELKKLMKKPSDAKFKKLIEKGAVIAENVFPAIAKGLSKRYIDMDVIDTAIEGAAKATTEILKKEIDQYTKRQKGLTDFRSELEHYITSNISKKPLIFLIDELDRCRPDYSVEVLEHIKHFFSVPGIVFVLAIDKKQLGNAIKGYYGSEGINTDEYLRRFIDIEYVIPEPQPKVFCEYLFNYYDFKKFFHNEKRAQYKELQGEAEYFIKFSSLLFEKNNLALRQQEKIFSHARLALSLFSSDNYLFPAAFILLVYINSYHKDLYQEILNRKLSLQVFIERLEDILPATIPEDSLRSVISTEAILLQFYYNFYRKVDYNATLIDLKDNEEKIAINSRFQTTRDESLLLTFLKDYRFQRYESTSLDYLLNKIALLENIKM